MDPHLSRAPALERGLQICEVVAHADLPVSFAQLRAMTGIPKSSLIRLLDVLRDNNYLRRTSSGWTVGRALALLRGPADRAARLRSIARGTCKKLMQSVANTVLLLHCEGEVNVTIDKIIRPGGVVMREVGCVGGPEPDAPWGWLMLMALPPDRREESLAQLGRAARRALEEQLQATARLGYAVDDRFASPTLYRLAAPVRLPAGQLISCLGMAAREHTLSKREKQRCIAAICESARNIEERLALM